MRNLFFLLLIFVLTIAVFPQKSKSNSNQTKLAASQKTDEKSDLDNAVQTIAPEDRIVVLQAFIEKYPKSKELNRVRELVVSARAEFADKKFQAGDFQGGIELLKTAIIEAPTPVSDRLFTVILTFPSNLYLREQVIPAYDVADLIAERAAGNPERLVALATFYIQIENGVYAKKLAEQAIELDPNSAKAYQTLGLANRLIFFLNDAADAYAKAAELEGETEASAKRNLADLKRALGKSEEAVSIYREILAIYPDDLPAQTGMTLALFDAGRQTEAESELQKTLSLDSNNLTLLVGAAYWYAANNQPKKAIDHAKEAIVIEPRYIWSYIALARALRQQKNPLEAEKVLLTARQYGNFPTLSYEIASVRMQAGFFREAADELKQNFNINNGILQTKLGGRVTAESENFIELLQLERQASIFQRVAADNISDAGKLKALMVFSNLLNSVSTENTKITEAADNFIKGDDKMKFHRQVFTATRLLEANKDTEKVKEIVKSAIPLLDSSLNVDTPVAAILADELYESRKYAISKGELLIIPEVPKQTLQTVLRGKIEEISGWAEQQESNPERAIVHFKRGLSIMPKDSAMWHSTMWRLGAALQAQGKNKEALDSYIQSYKDSTPNAGRYFVIETLYREINGTTDGLEKKIGQKPAVLDDVTAIANAPVTPKTVSQPENSENSSENNVETTENKIPETITEENQLTETEKSNETEKPQTNEPDKPIEENKPIESEKQSETVVNNSTEMESSNIPLSENTTTESSVSSENTNSEQQTTETLVPTEEKNPEVNVIVEDKTGKTQTKALNEVIPTETENSTANDQSETTTIEEKITPEQTVETPKEPASNQPNPLFAPIIIGIPKTQIIKTPKTETSETLKETQPDEKSSEMLQPVNNGAVRPRLIYENKPQVTVTGQCKIVVTQENVSILNDGGNLGILVALENAPDGTEIKAVSSSPNDVEAVSDPNNSSFSSSRLFFIIRSISKNKGIFTITFIADCGKKEISVKVR